MNYRDSRKQRINAASDFVDGELEPAYWVWVFEVAIYEMRRRGNANCGDITEPEAVTIPAEWDEVTVLRSLIYATHYSYIDLPPTVASSPTGQCFG